MSLWDQKEVKRLINELPYFNALIKNHTLNVLIT